jgi:hypothetical protein
MLIDCGSNKPTCELSGCDGPEGTRIGMILEDRSSVEVPRKEVDELVARFLEEL